MRIKEACEATGLTRKAIRYYESAGLISPDIDPNGYRNFSDEVIQQLALIGVLRGFRLSITEIRECLKGEDALSAQVEKKINEYEAERDRVSVELELLREFVSGNHSLEEVAALRQRTEATLRDRPGYLRERLHQLFPGDFGEVVAAVYGNMLDQKLETPEQHTAWLTLVADLDELEPIDVPEEIAEWARERNDESQIARNVARMKSEYSQEYEEFSQHKREAAEQYVNETSEEDRSESAECTKMMASFLAGTGLPLLMAVGRHMPVLSSDMANFGDKAQRFISENPDLLRRMMGSKQ